MKPWLELAQSYPQGWLISSMYCCRRCRYVAPLDRTCPLGGFIAVSFPLILAALCGTVQSLVSTVLQNGFFMRIHAVIPARYQSTRLPGKPLLNETGKYLVQHVYERAAAARSIAGVTVATDDRRIYDAVLSFGGQAMMTSPDHPSGTDRVAEVARWVDADAFINVQGDEPEIDPAMIDAAAGLLADDRAAISTLAVRSADPKRFLDPNCVKVVTDRDGFALYFSRSPLPGGRKLDDRIAAPGFSFLVHVGLYGFRRDFLMRFARLAKSPLEELESLEQLRALENGYRIKLAVVEHEAMGVDTPEDYARFVERWKKK